MKAQNDNGKQTKSKARESRSRVKAADEKANKPTELEAAASLPMNDESAAEKSARKKKNSIPNGDISTASTEAAAADDDATREDVMDNNDTAVGNEAAADGEISDTESPAKLGLSEAVLGFNEPDGEITPNDEATAESDGESRERFIIPDDLFGESADNSDNDESNASDIENNSDDSKGDAEGCEAEDAQECIAAEADGASAVAEADEHEADALGEVDAEAAEEIGDGYALFPADDAEAAEEYSVSEADDEEMVNESDESSESNEAGDGAVLEEAELMNAPDGDDASGHEDIETAEEADVKKSRTVDMIFEMVETLVFAIAAVFILITFFFRYSVVDGGSMDKTLADKQMLIISNFLYEPEGGDIVVLHSTALGKPIIKRVIAVGGQTVRITKTDIFVDGERLDEPYVHIDDRYISEMGEYFYSVYPDANLYPILKDQVDGEYYEILVPEGEIFVLGDHRNDSLDSRAIGTVDEDSIIGKAVLRFYPFDKFGKIEE